MKFYSLACILAGFLLACEGPQGFNSLVDISDEPAGANCAAGGVKISSGVDSNDNGVLDADEVTATKFVWLERHLYTADHHG